MTRASRFSSRCARDRNLRQGTGYHPVRLLLKDDRLPNRSADKLMRALLNVVLIGFAAAPPAVAYVQDRELEARLGANDSQALAMLPAKGFRDGASGFFKSHELRVVPGSERAWCQDQNRGILKPGCYVEFHFQGKGLKGRTSQSVACGRLGRWYRAPGTKNYVPTPGAFYAKAIANDDSEVVESAIYDDLEPACR